MSAVRIRVGDRVWGLPGEQAQVLAGQLQRRLKVPEHVGQLADALWTESQSNLGSLANDIELYPDQKRDLLEAMTGLTPPGEDRTAWDELAGALQSDLAESATP